jgi:hypothetical protein
LAESEFRIRFGWGSGIHPLTHSAAKRLQRYSFHVTVAFDGGQKMLSDDEVGLQILSIFMKHKVVAGGVLRRNHFIDVRDADFQRGLNKAVGNHWLKVNLRDRYTYELTEAGLAAGLSNGIASV